MKDKLASDIKIELENLSRIVFEMNELLKEKNSNSENIRIRAAGSILHDYYCGVEKIFKRIAINIDESLPQDLDWHKKILTQMSRAFEDKRNALIDEKLTLMLKEYLTFRHLFRNIYGFKLSWVKIEPLCIKLDDIHKEVLKSIESFLNKLTKI